jgi:hypothetical protein
MWNTEAAAHATYTVNLIFGDLVCNGILLQLVSVSSSIEVTGSSVCVFSSTVFLHLVCTEGNQSEIGKRDPCNLLEGTKKIIKILTVSLRNSVY